MKWAWFRSSVQAENPLSGRGVDSTFAIFPNLSLEHFNKKKRPAHIQDEKTA